MKKEPLDTIYNGTQCVDEVRLLNYALRTLPPEEEKRVESHLKQCDLCLMKVQEFVSIQHELDDGQPDTEVPLALVEKVNRGFKASEAGSSSADSIPRLIIRLAADGIKLLKESVLPENAEIEWVDFAAPQYAFRGEEEKGGDKDIVYKETIEEKNILIKIVIRKEGGDESVQAEILLKKFPNPMQNMRVTLKRDGRIVRSKKTDVEGFAAFTELHPAEYIIQIPSENIEWKVEIAL